ncbi:hypothetical protein EGW08_003138 [Elysia chlorotica]|uniref:Uncharacterized protein n=1 Tax=Elysia chlorotica TaxID=188477 RepID=A0A3S1BQN9_ELYCH|nr:hypothetical protein EGW08_003138 [Elysia chlorotica]
MREQSFPGGSPTLSRVARSTRSGPVNFYGSQDLPVTSEEDSWRKLARPKTGSLYAPCDGQFYHWGGQSNDSVCSDTYAWNIFSRPCLMTSSPRPQPTPWRQYDLDHPRPTEGILFDPKRNGFYSWSKPNRMDNQRFTSQDGLSDQESWSQSTITSRSGSGYDVNGNTVSSNSRRRFYGRRDRSRNCLDVSLILCRHELRRLFPEEDSEDEEPTHSVQENRKEVQKYSTFHRNLTRRRDEELLRTA